jgi:hypothetical protein
LCEKETIWTFMRVSSGNIDLGRLKKKEYVAAFKKMAKE